MSPLNVISILVFVTSLAVGQTLFKVAADRIAGLPAKQALVNLLAAPTFYLAIALYGATTVLWIWILSRVPLSAAYPFMGLTMIIVPVMGWWFFGEMVGPRFWVGAVLISIGLVLTQA